MSASTRRSETLPRPGDRPYDRPVRFRCARCGQRYSTTGQPASAPPHRLTCLVCGGVVTLKGGDFPALPTSPPDPRHEARADVIYDAAAEEPLGLALTPMAVEEPRRPQHRSSTAARAPALLSSRLRIAAGGAAALAAMVGLFLWLRQPASETPPAAARPAAPAAAIPGEALTGGAGAGEAPRASAQSLARGVPAGAASPSPGKLAPLPPPAAAGKPAASISEGRHETPPPPPHPASAPDQKAGGSAAPAPPTGGRSGPQARSVADRVVPDALAARRSALDACAQEWAREAPWLWVAGRRVEVSLIVDPSGAVTSCALDDQDLDGSSLGACLRKVLGKPFPPFEGEALQVRIPLRLGQ